MEIKRINSLQDLQHTKIGRALGRTFFNEPNFTYIIPDEKRRTKILSWFFGRFVVNLGKIYGEIYTSENDLGAAIWMKPEKTVNAWGAVRAGLFKMPLHFRLDEMRRSMKLSNYIEQIRDEYAPQPHWYLVALGVDPEVQGRGIGSLLLKPVLSRADREGTECYLETFSKKSRAFYTKLGFEVIEEHQVPQEGPLFWSMSREPAH